MMFISWLRGIFNAYTSYIFRVCVWKINTFRLIIWDDTVPSTEKQTNCRRSMFLCPSFLGLWNSEGVYALVRLLWRGIYIDNSWIFSSVTNLLIRPSNLVFLRYSDFARHSLFWIRKKLSRVTKSINGSIVFSKMESIVIPLICIRRTIINTWPDIFFCYGTSIMVSKLINSVKNIFKMKSQIRKIFLFSIDLIKKKALFQESFKT